MGLLGRIADAVESFNVHVDAEVRRARKDAAYAAEWRARWEELRAKVEWTRSPTGTALPRLALPQTDEPGAIIEYLLGQGLPGKFPFANGAYREMYLDREHGGEEPTRLFAGLGLAEDTNKRFRYLARHQKSIRLSTAFDGPTLYGLDSDHEGVLGKVGEGGVAIDTVEDMERLFAGFDLTRRDASVSMTINAPAPAILAMYLAAARRRFGPSCVKRLRGTIQADILKEVQAQNEIVFPVESSLRFLCDMMQWCVGHMPRWYPISISGYHIAEAGATPVQQGAFTLANGFTYVDLMRERGMDVNRLGPRLSFFLDCGLDVEYLVLGRVSRRIWAIGMRDVFGADALAQLFKLHTQTSGRSLIAAEFQNNLTRTAVELVLAYLNGTNSCHSNAADEPFTTPSEHYARLASHAQSIILEESGLFRHTMNLLAGAPGTVILEREVENGILAIFRDMDALGGVLAAQEQRYQRSKIQEAGHAYEKQVGSGARPIIGLNRNVSPEKPPRVSLARTPRGKQRRQVERLRAFKRKHARQAPEALQRLENIVRESGNVFAELLNTVEVCSLGQITECLTRVVGRFRPMV